MIGCRFRPSGFRVLGLGTLSMGLGLQGVLLLGFGVKG